MQPDKAEAELKTLARTFGVRPDATDFFAEVEPLIICGVTAAGKNVLERYLIAHGPFVKVVTHTNRPPRRGETNGQDYWFADSAQMLEMAKRNEFIEMQLIHDNVYGISVMAIKQALSTRKRPILNINVDGAINLTKSMPRIRPLLLIPPSYYEWMQRLGSRSRISDGERNRRMHSAKEELEKTLKNRQFIFLTNKEVSHTGDAIIKGLSAGQIGQEQSRGLAQELLDYIRSR